MAAPTVTMRRATRIPASTGACLNPVDADSGEADKEEDEDAYDADEDVDDENTDGTAGVVLRGAGLEEMKPLRVIVPD